jgi:hypothetical protein
MAKFLTLLAVVAVFATVSAEVYFEEKFDGAPPRNHADLTANPERVYVFRDATPPPPPRDGSRAIGGEAPVKNSARVYTSLDNLANMPARWFCRVQWLCGPRADGSQSEGVCFSG